MAVPRTSTKNKRTPRGTVDDAQRAEDDEWEVDKISARRQKGQVVQYLVHWKGCEDFNATWEPASHLAGAAETVAKYEKEWAKEQKQLDVHIDVLAWWHHHEDEFPTISEMA